MGRVMSAVKRPDSVPRSRRERARATRLRITKAAYALFGERGYTGTTMADIADAAGVAVQTVYFVFHTKTDLLNSAYSLAVLGEDEPVPPQAQGWYRQAVAEPDLATAVSLVLKGVGEILRRVAPLDMAVRTAAVEDPDAARFLAQNERLRADGYRGMVEFLRQKRPLRVDVSEEQATDIMLFLASPGAHRALVAERGWSHAEWVAWSSGALAEQVFGVQRQGAIESPGSG
jgi:AcrR family transcriptional regulator